MKKTTEKKPQKFTKKTASTPVNASSGREFRRAPLYVWGRRTVEAFLADLAAGSQAGKREEKFAHHLHIIADREGKAPLQLKSSVQAAGALGIKVVLHRSAEEEWPLAGVEDINHQRICLSIPEYPQGNLEDVISLLHDENSTEPVPSSGCLGVVLDQIQDPRNFGAIIRSAAYFGVKFIIYATDRQAGVSATVLKTSAGGAFSVSLVPTVNINRALKQLQEAGLWIVGTSLEDSAVSLESLPKDRRWVAVLGNESKGLRPEVAKNCDYLVKIPGGRETVDSLNVSVAAGIVLHALQVKP